MDPGATYHASLSRGGEDYFASGFDLSIATGANPNPAIGDHGFLCVEDTTSAGAVTSRRERRQSA